MEVQGYDAESSYELSPKAIGTKVYLYILNRKIHVKFERRRITGVAEAIRLIAQRSGLWREASPSAEADLKGIFISFLLLEIVLCVLWNPKCGVSNWHNAFYSNL